MSQDAVISGQQSDGSGKKTSKEDRLTTKLIDQQMINDREIIPQHTIFYAIHLHLIYTRDFRGMSYPASESRILTMDTIGIYLAFSGRQQMSDTLMHSVEKPLPVKRAAFKYDSYSIH